MPWCQQTTAIPLPSGVIPAAKVESSRQQRGPSWSHGHAHGDRRAERSTDEAEALLDNMRLLYAGSAGSAGQAGWAQPVCFGHIHPMIAQSQATCTIHISCAFLLPMAAAATTPFFTSSGVIIPSLSTISTISTAIGESFANHKHRLALLVSLSFLGWYVIPYSFRTEDDRKKAKKANKSTDTRITYRTWIIRAALDSRLGHPPRLVLRH